jgi:hypothetical protein
MYRNSFVKTATLAALLVAAGAGSALAGGPKVGTTAGNGYEEWSARWWQWMTSIPTAVNPQNNDGAVDCTLGQQGPVWFLAGAPTGVTAERSCTVKKHKPLFFPLFNAVFYNGPGESVTVAEKREILDGLLSDLVPGIFADFGLPGSRACKLFVEIDGQPATYSAPVARVQSPPFYLDTGDGPNTLPPGITDEEAVTDGFWVMLPALSAGGHTLHFGGRLCQFDNVDDHPLAGPVDVTYHLTVTHQP